MNKTIRYFIILQLSLLACTCLRAQSQWKFHLAFEDATGARDTVWMIWDTTASLSFPIDTALGEGKVIIDNSKMNVFIFNANGDTTKTSALPYITFPFHQLDNIHAINYVLPIVISWDSSLFNSPILPSHPNPYEYINRAYMNSMYFDFNNNDPNAHSFNMMWTDNVIAPVITVGAHFPLFVKISYDPNAGLSTKEFDTQSNTLRLAPVPVQTELKISTDDIICKIFIYDINGKIAKSKELNSCEVLLNYQFSLSELDNGLYTLTLITKSNTFLEKRIVLLK